jgi:hypothetical protein
LIASLSFSLRQYLKEFCFFNFLFGNWYSLFVYLFFSIELPGIISWVMNSTGSPGLARPFFSLLLNIFGSRINDHNLGFCSFKNKYASSQYLYCDKNKWYVRSVTRTTYLVVIILSHVDATSMSQVEDLT